MDIDGARQRRSVTRTRATAALASIQLAFSNPEWPDTLLPVNTPVLTSPQPP